jgi:hypothetical protein
MICPTISTSLRAQRSNPSRREKKEWIASSQVLLAMTMWRGGALRDRNVTARRANHSGTQKPVQPPRKKYFAFSEIQISRNVRIVSPRSEGRTRRHGRWVRDAMDVVATQDERRYRGRRSRVVLAPRRWR